MSCRLSVLSLPSVPHQSESVWRPFIPTDRLSMLELLKTFAAKSVSN